MRRDDTSAEGGVEDELLAAVAGVLPSLPDVGADIPDRFARGVRAVVETRAQTGWPGEDDESDVAMFVFVDRPRDVGERFAGKPVTDPVATQEGLLGSVFFMNRDATHGRRIPLPAEPGALLDWLADHALADRPVILIYRKTSTMVTRRSGVDGRAVYDPIRDKKPTATVEELLEALDYFHERQLTPSTAADGLWEAGRASQYVPGPLPEKAIQGDLELALNFWFHGVLRAEVEDSTPIGRIDVRLLKKSMHEQALAYWAIVELKIIKTYRNAPRGNKPSVVGTTDNVKAIAEGLLQAVAYRRDRAAEEALLEVFDLRKDKSTNLMMCSEIASLLTALNPIPICSIRSVYGSASDARRAGRHNI
jgi:hypothetical protein